MITIGVSGVSGVSDRDANEDAGTQHGHRDEAERALTGVESLAHFGGENERRKLRDVLGHFATGVTTITTIDRQGRNTGVTVNSFSSLSLNPPLILWSLAKSATSYACFQTLDPFAVNMIARDQHQLARQFAKSTHDKFAGVTFHRGLDGVPLLVGCVAYLECVTEARYPGGDHEIIVGRVRRLFNVGHAPLLFHRGTFHLLGDPVAVR